MTAIPTLQPRRFAPLWHRRLLTAMLVLAALLSGAAAQAQSCSPYQLSLPKGQALYLLMPTNDTTVTVGGETYDVGEFNIHDLDSSIGYTWMLRQLIYETVQDTFCELSVDVQLVTAPPTPSEPRWQIAGIGSDVAVTEEELGAFGRSYGVDIGDMEGIDNSRIWAGEFFVHFGNWFQGDGPLQGPYSTLTRWANAIAGTAAHEAAHNYGLEHVDAAPQPGTVEDAKLYHVMATGGDFGDGFDRGDNRAKRVRHFSDTSFEILGHNIGLNTKMVSNWDFTNPNDVAATSLTLRVLSQTSSLSPSTVFSGGLSPWQGPSVVVDGIETFQGQSYFAWDVVFDLPKSWDNGPAGEVPPGKKFHVGVGFQEDHVLRSVTLADASGPLPLQPRMVGYNSDSLKSLSDYKIVLWKLDNASASDDYTVSDMKIDFLPRPMDIGSMMADGEMLSSLGLPVEPFARQPGRSERPGEVVGYVGEMTVGETPVEVTVARLSDLRHVDVTYDATGCELGWLTEEGFIPFAADVNEGEIVGCPDGTSLSLFPATYTYVTATVVDPEAYHWDADAGGFVTGPLESRLYFQIAGLVPDLNRNGTDDLLDVRSGTSLDENGNGVPDEVEGGGR